MKHMRKLEESLRQSETRTNNKNRLPVRGLPNYLISFAPLLLFICGCLAPAVSYCEDLSVESLGIRARVSEQTLLGEDAPEDFKAYDVSANFSLPWKRYATSGWGMGTRLMASTGILRGVGKNALVVSLIPELTLGSEDGRFTLDFGAGVALFSRHRFGTQDFGGPFQFALTLGVGVPFYKKLGISYRFQHYSDARINGSNTTGADFHMIELSYRF